MFVIKKYIKFKYFFKNLFFFFLFNLNIFSEEIKLNIIQEIPVMDEIHEKILNLNNNDEENNNFKIENNNNEINNLDEDESSSTTSENSEKSNSSENKTVINSLQKELNEIHDLSIKATSNDLKLKKDQINSKPDNKFSEMNERTNRVTALGSAMGAIDLGSTPTKKIRFGAGLGNSSSSQAVAVGVGYAPTENFKVNTKFSSSTNNIDNNSISVGASYDLDL